MAQTFRVPLVDDFHIHLRHKQLMHLVAGQLNDQGIDSVYVMPNLVPPITTAAQAMSYKQELESICPHIHFMMTLYLHPDLTVQEIQKASKAGVMGVKSYPRGVTTNSDAGIESYKPYYPIFAEMARLGMVLNIHGEVPSDAGQGVCVLNAEEMFLKHLKELHQDFPQLKIVLEHATTKAAVDLVKSLGPTVACTITIHHLELVVDDWAGCCHNFCKPVAKYPSDREALRQAVLSGNPKFFLGTDSAPHPKHAKEGAKSAAGVYTGAYILPYLAHALDAFGALDKLESFACVYGRQFYGLDVAMNAKGTGPRRHCILQRDADFVIPTSFSYTDDQGQLQQVVPYRAGQKLGFNIQYEGKRSISMNMKSRRIQQLILNVLPKIDVLIDPFRPGVLEKMGLGPTEALAVNPRLVYARMTGFGQQGSFAHMAGHDINYIALTGALSSLGRQNQPPMFPNNLLGDFAGGGMLCAMGILLALHERHHSGKGQVVDAAMIDGAAYLSSFIYKMKHQGLWNAPRGENVLDSGAHFYEVYQTKDGHYMAVGAIEPHFYAVLLQGLGLNKQELPDQMDSSQWPYMKQVFARVFKEKTRQEWQTVFQGTDACCTPVLTMDATSEERGLGSDVMSLSHNQQRHLLVQDPVTGHYEPSPAPRLSRTPALPVNTVQPHVGEHTIQVLKEWGVPSHTIRSLIDERLVLDSQSKL